MRSKFSSFDPTRRQMIRSMVSGSALLPAILQQCLADTGDDLAPVSSDPAAVASAATERPRPRD